MKILYISSAFPMEEIDNISKNCTVKLQVSNSLFHNNIMTGLTQNNIEVHSVVGLPISNYHSKKIFWKSKNKTLDNSVNYHQISFINLPILKHISVLINTYKYINYWCKNVKEENDVIIYDGTYINIFPCLLFFQKKYKLSMYSIIADVYEYMADVDNQSKYSKKLVKIMKNYAQKIYKKTKGYVFLTEEMKQLFPQKPGIVIEGTVQANSLNLTNNQKSNNNKIIMYAGGLYDKFGVKNLVDAFMKMKNKNYELWIYGYGELEEYIQNAVFIDSRIKFGGMINHSDILKNEKEATILVNPRPTNLEFEKYSFPSKLLEYMSSGTPTITTKLTGIPKEYSDYLFFFEDYSVESIMSKIQEVLNLEEAKLNDIGLKAKKFIINNKNPKIQTEKIINMINSK